MDRFDTLFAAAIRSSALEPRPLAPGECRSAAGEPCGLCHAMRLEYAAEADARERAVTEFWSDTVPGVPIDPLVRSPRGRGYRTVSKRKLFRLREGARESVRLGLVPGPESRRPGGISVLECAIEPPVHGEIYRAIDAELRLPGAVPLRDALQYVIIKGSYREWTVILNVAEITPRLIRTANGLSRSLSRILGTALGGCHLFEGDPEGRYYLEARTGGGIPESRKIFGKSGIAVRAGGKGFVYPPLAFSQVNGSILDLFVEGVRRLLRPSPASTLYDLYCGYGLFACVLAGEVRRVIGADQAHLAVGAAAANARRQGAANVRFIRAVLTGEGVGDVMARSVPGSLVILDPPRGGTAAGVIEEVALREPSRAVHIFCNPELLGRELARWRSSGYDAVRGVPFDMFPGTSEIELMVLLEPAQRGGKRSNGTSRTG